MPNEHTPGPWTLGPGRMFTTQTGVFYLAYGREPGTNAPRFRDPAELDANARLIAAAPDLLAALEWALPYIETALTVASSSAEESSLERAQAAIRRARSARGQHG